MTSFITLLTAAAAAAVAVTDDGCRCGMNADFKTFCRAAEEVSASYY